MFLCYMNKNTVIIDSELSSYRDGSHEVLFVTLQYITTPFLQYFLHLRPQTFLNLSSFVRYLLNIIIQNPA